MGLGRRFLDGARANLNALMELALRDELHGASEAQLEAELQRRQHERSEQESERQHRMAMEAAARSRGSARKKQEKDPPRRAPVGEARARQLRLQSLYAMLGATPGADLEVVKKSYRALMQKHHPDRHAGDREAERLASDQAARISAAYAELESLLQE
jgi:hypothetical protein